MNTSFWRAQSVFVTGHTGFKGGWLSLWLRELGAKVHGYALAPSTSPSLFQQAKVDEFISSTIGDVRDLSTLVDEMRRCAPSVIFHLAAQPLVREGYSDAPGTYATNVMGTVNVLEAARSVPSVRAIVIVTTDKCYENREWAWPYRETDRLGGRDPYSSSKACAELVTDAYRQSFFQDGRTGIATVRAGNVVGGGDWAADRIVPDAIRAFIEGVPVEVRNPASVRPWQHVIEALAGYLLLAENLARAGEGFASSWNFGPSDEQVVAVQELVETLATAWGEARWVPRPQSNAPHEARLLRLDSSKARSLLGWSPLLSLRQSAEWIAEWHRHVERTKDARSITLEQLQRYMSLRAHTTRVPGG